MKSGILSLATFVCLVGATPAPTQQSPADLSPEVLEFVTVDARAVALVGVRVIDGTGAPPSLDQTVLIRDGLVEAMGASDSLPVPESVEVLALPGHTVLPGFVGMHNHLGFGYDFDVRQDAKLYLAAGVTTIRTAGTYEPYRQANLKRAIDEGRFPGPRIQLTAPYLTGTGAPNLRMAQVATPEEARRFVRVWADQGLRWIKVYTRIRRAELAAVIDEAHSLGLGVTGHLCAVTAREAAQLGIDNIEHGPGNHDFDADKPADTCPPGPYNDAASDEPIRALIDALVANNVALTATLPEAEAYEPAHAPADPRVFNLMRPGTRAAYDDLRARLEAMPPLGYFPRVKALIRDFVAAGGLLVAGTDPVLPGLIAGLADQRNYELLLEAGFRPEQAVQIMTANGARLLGLEATLGTVSVGNPEHVVVELRARYSLIAGAASVSDCRPRCRPDQTPRR